MYPLLQPMSKNVLLPPGESSAGRQGGGRARAGRWRVHACGFALWGHTLRPGAAQHVTMLHQAKLWRGAAHAPQSVCPPLLALELVHPFCRGAGGPRAVVGIQALKNLAQIQSVGALAVPVVQDRSGQGGLGWRGRQPVHGGAGSDKPARARSLCDVQPSRLCDLAQLPCRL